MVYWKLNSCTTCNHNLMILQNRGKAKFLNAYFPRGNKCCRYLFSGPIDSLASNWVLKLEKFQKVLTVLWNPNVGYGNMYFSVTISSALGENRIWRGKRKGWKWASQTLFFLKSGLLDGSITLPFNLTERYCSSLNPFFSISISERIRIGAVRLLTGGVCLLIPGHTHP